MKRIFCFLAVLMIMFSGCFDGGSSSSKSTEPDETDPPPVVEPGISFRVKALSNGSLSAMRAYDAELWFSGWNYPAVDFFDWQQVPAAENPTVFNDTAVDFSGDDVMDYVHYNPVTDRKGIAMMMFLMQNYSFFSNDEWNGYPEKETWFSGDEIGQIAYLLVSPLIWTHDRLVIPFDSGGIPNYVAMYTAGFTETEIHLFVMIVDSLYDIGRWPGPGSVIVIEAAPEEMIIDKQVDFQLAIDLRQDAIWWLNWDETDVFIYNEDESLPIRYEFDMK